jgi:hypothetical protein
MRRRSLAKVAEDFDVPRATIRRATAVHGPFPVPGAQLPDGGFGVAGVATRAGLWAGLSLPSILRWRVTGRLPKSDLVTTRGRDHWLADDNRKAGYARRT